MSIWTGYDAWKTAYPPEWDYEDEDVPCELDEVFTFGNLKYVLTGAYEGDTLEDARLFLLTNYGRVEQDWGETDMISETGHMWPITVPSLTDRCYDVAKAAFDRW